MLLARLLALAAVPAGQFMPREPHRYATPPRRQRYPGKTKPAGAKLSRMAAEYRLTKRS